MVNLQKSGDSAVKIVFTDSDHYLYGNGEIEVPVNSLLLVIDESDMVTFKKLSGDPFLSFRADNSNLGTKAAIEQFYKDNMVGSTGGGSGSGVTPSEVQEMIDSSISGKADASALTSHADNVNVHFSGTQKSNYDYLEGQYYVDDEWDIMPQTAFNNFTSEYSMAMGQFDQRISANTSAIATKADTSALTAVANDVQTVSGQVQTKVATSDFNAYSAATATAIGNKQDALVYYSEIDDIEESLKFSHIEVRQGTDEDNVSATFDVSTHYTEDEKSSGVYIQTDINNDDGIVGSHINVENGFIDISNEYTPNEGELSESHIYMSNNGSIEIGNNNENGGTLMFINPTGVTINYERVATEPYVDAATSGKVDTSAITTAITSGSTDAEIPTAKAVYDATQSGGGGMDDDTQQLISTAFNDLNDRKADLTELSKYQKKGDYIKTSTLADYMTNASFDEYATAKERIISGALNDLNDKFGGIRLVKISQADYDNLATKDENTLYIINNVI